MAAFFVMSGHVRNLFFCDYSHITNPNWIVKGIYFLTGFGNQSVTLFFVLSGLLVGGKAVETIREGKWSWKRYLIERAVRLCIVLWPALLLTAGWDALGKWLFDFPSLYPTANLGTNILPKDPSDLFSLRTYLANAFFLQGAIAPTAGTNWPLWSLSVEFWYYLAFPALFLILDNRQSRLTRARNTLFFLSVFFIICRSGFFQGFLVWIMGVWVSQIHPKLDSHRKQYLCLGFATLLLILFLIYSRFASFPYTDFGTGAFVSFLCFAMLNFSGRVNRHFSSISDFLSRFSYTLYLTHLPLIVFIRAALLEIPRWHPNALPLLYGAGLCCVALGWAYLVYRLTEAHTSEVRRYLLKIPTE